MNYKVLDTNILLLDANNAHTLGSEDTIIVLPETVLDEVDAKKSGVGELAFQARSLGRLLTAGKMVKRTKLAALTISEILVEGKTIWVVASSNYIDLTREDPKIINDRKIIDIAVQLSKVVDNVTFISNDVMCRLRADSLGLPVGDVKDIQRVSFTFVKELRVPHDIFTTVHGTEVKDVDPKYKIENYNYKIISEDTDQMKLATVKNGLLTVIGRETEAELRKQEINPANAEQLFMSKAIQDHNIDIIVVNALAGSGKTLVALSNAIRLVTTNSPYDSITYIRASVNDVEDQEEVGFLPGSAEDKNAIYLHPLYDSLDYMVRTKYAKGNKGMKGSELDEKIAEGVERLKQKCGIIGITGLGMRGRTFHGTVAIIDEVQNMSKNSLQKVMTRFGKNCKIILIGSNNQIDHPYLNKYTNGLSVLLDACAKEQTEVVLHAVSLQKVVRGKIAEFSEKLFSDSKND